MKKKKISFKMALFRIFVGSLSSSVLPRGNVAVLSKTICTTTARSARYPPTYIEPICQTEKLAELDKMTIKALAHSPVKAARIEHTSSVFYDPVLEKFLNIVMKCGAKKVARRLMDETYERMKRIQLKKYRAAPEDKRSEIECNPSVIFHGALENCKPVMILTGVKRGGMRYQVPTPVTPQKSNFLGMKWLVLAVRDRDMNVKFPEQMARELLDAFHSQGRVVKRKQDLHKQCEANKAFAHFRSA